MEDNVRSVDRTFDILEAIAASGQPVGLSGIAADTGLSKSTVHRLLATLCDRQYVDKNPDGTYGIGYKLMELVSHHINQIDVLTEARPFLNSLSRELSLTTHLGILDGTDVIYVEKMDIIKPAGGYAQIGQRSPAYCSSIGKCLLACLSGDELEEALYGYRFEKHTCNTITDAAEFKRYLRVVRKQGWAIDNEEFELGHRCVGAPVYDYRGSAIAAVSASGSTHEMPDGALESIIKRVVETASLISRKLGYPA